MFLALNQAPISSMSTLRSTLMRWMLAGVYVLSLGGCLASNPSQPSWVSTQPEDRAAYYSVGEGTTLFDASRNARAAMAAGFSANVSSVTEITQEQDGSYSREIYKQWARVSVSDIRLDQAQIARQELVNHHYYVQLRLEKSALARQLMQELSQDGSALQNVLQQQHKIPGDTFLHWWQLRLQLAQAKRLDRNLNLLASLQAEGVVGQQPFAHEAEVLKHYFDAFNSSYAKRTLGLRNLTGTTDFEDSIGRQLQQQEIQLASFRDAANRSFIELSIDDSAKKIGRQTYVDSTLWVRLKSPRGQILATSSVTAKGVSYKGALASQAISRRAIAKKLSRLDVVSELIADESRSR